MKKIIVGTTITTAILVLIHSLFINKVFANTTCIEKVDNIEYFNATLYNYNAINLNAYARGYTIDEFNKLSVEERINIDKKHTLFSSPGYMSTWGKKKYGGADLMYGGWQNGIQQVEKINERVYLYSIDGAKQGLVQNKLLNDNIVLTYKNNNIELFPNQKQAEEKGLVGENQVYKEILRNYKIPFIKEKSGYYSFDSDEYHLRKGENDKFELHKGIVGGLSEWEARRTGLFPFNKECYTSSDTKECNELYYSIRLDIPFYMTENGKNLNLETNKLEDMIFDFRGDDDVWVFVDDSLVLDLGGGHRAIKGYVNFSQNMSYVEATIDKNNEIYKDVYVNNLFGTNLLNEGEHTLKIFYIERFRRHSKLQGKI